MQFPPTTKILYICTVVLTTLLLSSSAVLAQGFSTLRSQFQASDKYLAVGDRVDVTLKVTFQTDKPLTEDRKARFTIKGQDPGERCETTDDTFKDDGQIKGWCEATGQSGDMEIAISVDNQSSISHEGTTYSPLIYDTYKLRFNDRSTACKDDTTPPSSLMLLKQNDVTVDVKWQHLEGFVGFYDVMYGTVPGQYPFKQRTENKSVVIDSLDSSKDYYFRVNATSACKTTASSQVLRYNPRTGSVSAVSEKPTASASPLATAAPKASASAQKSSPKPSLEASPSAAVTTTPSVTPSLPSPSSSVETVESNTPASSEKKETPIGLLLVAVGAVATFTATVAGVIFIKSRKKPSAEDTST
jgi:hypothetical protein